MALTRRLAGALATLAAALPLAALVASADGCAADATLRDRWPAEQLQTLAAMHLERAGARPADPSNAVEGSEAAAALGQALFHDRRLSRDGRVACASCHDPAAQFEDGRALGQGQATGQRRTMPVTGALQAPFLFWDGRKDSLWSQALGPLEDAAEHGSNRLRLVRQLREHHEPAYRRVFGALPDLAGLPADAGPLGSPAEQAAWAALPAPTRDEVNRAFANLGKAIAAYESRVRVGASRFDRYVEATLARDGRAQEVLSPQEVRGLRLFLGAGQCATCHQGPLFSDQAFHNTGVPPRDPARPDAGRAEGVRRLQADEFNCLGRYSDAPAGGCGELQFVAAGDPAQQGAFRTPGLRNVAARPPYIHAGQFATLEAVLRHYASAPPAATGRSELPRPGERTAQRRPIELGEQDQRDLVAFLATLTGPVLRPQP